MEDVVSNKVMRKSGGKDVNGINVYKKEGGNMMDEPNWEGKDLDYACTLISFAEQVGIQLWQAMALMKYAKSNYAFSSQAKIKELETALDTAHKIFGSESDRLGAIIKEAEYEKIGQLRTMTLAKNLHKWYLEATKELNPKNYNPKAQVSFNKLNAQQKMIDIYIARKIIDYIKGGI